MSDKKRFEYLVAKGNSQSEFIVELAGLCLYGSISESEIETPSRIYSYEIDGESVKFKLQDDEPDIEDDIDLLDLIKIYLALSTNGIEVMVEGLWRGRFPDTEFLQKNKDYAFDFDVPLTFADLVEVGQFLTNEKRSIEELLKDESFRSVFPSVQSKWGSYGFMRHRSGVEIRTSWNDTVYIAAHGYEAPLPVQDLFESFVKFKKIDYDQEDGFIRFRSNKWKLAKMLARVPVEHKQKVYEWVDATQFAIEEFHDSHGRTYTPETFECYFGNCVITADRNYVFDLIEC